MRLNIAKVLLEFKESLHLIRQLSILNYVCRIGPHLYVDSPTFVSLLYALLLSPLSFEVLMSRLSNTMKFIFYLWLKRGFF